jgi:hypothetical protein
MSAYPFGAKVQAANYGKVSKLSFDSKPNSSDQVNVRLMMCWCGTKLVHSCVEATSGSRVYLSV